MLSPFAVRSFNLYERKVEINMRNERERERDSVETRVREASQQRPEKKWKFIETVIRTGGFAHSPTTRMLFGLCKIEFTGKFYTVRALLHFRLRYSVAS